MALKYSWYQTETHVILEFFVKGLKSEQILINLNGDRLSIRLPHLEELEKVLQLSNPARAYELDVESSKFIVSLEKTTKGTNWNSAENLQSSSKPKRDWSKISCDSDKEENENEQSVEKYFKDLFANAPEDVRKAMIKSYTESGGTVLSTNWSEVASSKVEPYDSNKKDNKE